MSQQEKREMLAELMKISIQAEAVVTAHRQHHSGDVCPAIDELGEMLDAFNAKWGDNDDRTVEDDRG